MKREPVLKSEQILRFDLFDKDLSQKPTKNARMNAMRKKSKMF
ncbi:hypothetical protein LEP1GSC060_0882 [Leptospira weilii serovar Ranarum str. ICFT]|uniref:Uncharacterized protein n=1 Tax=Leptospira weilii serovar Ranarum str. ICFT TaxID=1218598 RepID=N1WSS6_9LEPT|nr:hypothetical protein LEP1GSC060_0882 [Leptospira weilii serovar Ranarum str. ICFT]